MIITDYHAFAQSLWYIFGSLFSLLFYQQILAVHSMNSWHRDIITFMANGIAWVKSHKCKENGFDLHENEAVGRTHFHGFAQRLKLVHTDTIRLWVKKTPSQWFYCIFVAVLKLWRKFCGMFRRHSTRSPFQSFNWAHFLPSTFQYT